MPMTASRPSDHPQLAVRGGQIHAGASVARLGSDIAFRCRATTRPARGGSGRRRLSLHDRRRIQGEVADGGDAGTCACFGNFYGSPQGPVEDGDRSGQDVLFDIDWQGAQQIRTRLWVRTLCRSFCCRRRSRNCTAGCCRAGRTATR